MTEWTLKRFWTAARVAEAEGGFGVTLDGRAIRTPGKAPFVVPTEGLAHALAAEWDAQTERVDPRTMPMTRLTNSAIDTVAVSFEGVVEVISAYGETDLLCYRADGPEGLAREQDRVWAPFIDWAAGRYGARLRTTAGVLPVAQEAAALAALDAAVRERNPFSLAGLHDLVSLSGSLVLGLAAAEDAAPVDAIWTASRVDEEWQIAQWGRDEEADAAAQTKRAAFFDAKRYLDLSEGRPVKNPEK